MDTKIVHNTIAQLEKSSKQGVSYDNLGHHGWRNPVRADTGPILTALAVAVRPSRILEIGTGIGLSTLYLALSNAPIDSIEFDPGAANAAANIFSFCQADIRVTVGDADTTVPQLRGGYDLIFLDENKDGYKRHLELLRSSGKLKYPCVVIADNVIDRAKECADFVSWIQETWDGVIIPTECGLLVASINK